MSCGSGVERIRAAPYSFPSGHDSSKLGAATAIAGVADTE